MTNHSTKVLGKVYNLAQKELGEDKVEVKYLESKQDADYVPNIEQFVDEETDLIIGVWIQISRCYRRSS